MPEHFLTADGSSTLFTDRFGETYHSRHGAIQESQHVFLQMGLHALPAGKGETRILEMGLGTGLNALLTVLETEEKEIHYTGIEAFPITETLAQELNFSDQLPHFEASALFNAIHESPWGIWYDLTPQFHLLKVEGKLEEFETDDTYDLVYFDAFAPTTQPELWTEAIFTKVYHLLNPGGVLVTYSSKGDVRRAMIVAGFEVEKLPGPPGKREMLRGRKG